MKDMIMKTGGCRGYRTTAEGTGRYYITSMKPISVEVVTNLLTVLNHCGSCKLIYNEIGVEEEVCREALNEYPAELREELFKLSDWIVELARLYRHRIRISIIDAKSIPGVYKSLRHRFRKYPAFIVDKKDVVAGWDRDKLTEILDAHIRKEQLQYRVTNP
jgi:hypothetical protein